MSCGALGSPELDSAQSAVLKALEERARKHAADAERIRHVRAAARTARAARA